MTQWTVGKLKEVLAKYPDDASIRILFECPEARPNGWQYEVPVLRLAYSSRTNSLIFCHEEDYEGHYSKARKEDEK